MGRWVPHFRITITSITDLEQNQSRLGVAVSLEQANEDLMAQQETAMDAPSPPF